MLVLRTLVRQPTIEYPEFSQETEAHENEFSILVDESKCEVTFVDSKGKLWLADETYVGPNGFVMACLKVAPGETIVRDRAKQRAKQKPTQARLPRCLKQTF